MIKVNWERPWSQALAEGFFSFALPGLGQLYQGRIFLGIFCALIVGFGTFFSPWFGFAAHSIQCLEASNHSLKGTTFKDRMISQLPLVIILVLLAIRLS